MHLRLPDERNLEGKENLQFTHETATYYLGRLYNNPKVRITDTAHALLSFRDLDNLSRPNSETTESWSDKIITKASTETLKRVLEMKRLANNNIIMGIEVDIIDNQGHLSLNDECLKEIDFTIASFHRFIWTIFSEKVYYSPEDLVSMYLGAIDNPSVCVLGHPIRPSSKLVGSLGFDDFLPVIDKMNEKRVAYEINIIADLSNKQQELNLKIIKECSQVGTPLILGFDFHNAGGVDFLEDISLDNSKIEEPNLNDIFCQNTNIHYRVFRRLIKNIHILEKLGVTREQIVNSSDQNFDQWLAKRKLFN